MATIKPILDTRAVRKDKTYPIKISIAHRGKTAFIGINTSVDKTQWSGIKVVDHPKASGINRIIKNKIIQAENEIKDSFLYQILPIGQAYLSA